MTSLLAQALKKIEDEEKRTYYQSVIKTNQVILNRFKKNLGNFPIALELICKSIDFTQDLTNEKQLLAFISRSESGVMFYEEDLGTPKARLMQEVIQASRDQGATLENKYSAWAIKYADVYGYDIYFIPYTDPKRGFATVVIDPTKKDDEAGWKKFFPHDIGKNFAVEMIAKQLRAK